ncbi:MAG: hypothetical protein IJ307_01050 [Bacteroidales bacterium]|nr:hypothetical protein [Bacteroidales bacterium]
MKKDGKYRYSLQFGMNSEEEKRVGELLERLGNRKSKVLVAALNEYIANHPELENEHCEIKVNYQSVPMKLLEMKIRELIKEQFGGLTISSELNNEKNEQVYNVSQDIVDMLGDLELFQLR